MSFLNEPLLLVPMHIDALAVGKKPDKKMFQWTNLAPDLSKLDSDYQFGAQLLGESSGNPFDEADRLKPGIHLHFRLPRAFSHGHQAGAGDLVFPVIPNRWLVQRICPDSNNKKAHKAWLIKSDESDPKNLNAITWSTFPKDTTTAVELKSIGSFTELNAPIGGGDESAKVNLTVVGQGDPLFAAHYPACRSVLGFHDPMTDVAKGSCVSYLVTGWFSTADDDPLHGAGWRTGTIAEEVENRFRATNSIPLGDPLSTEQRETLLSEMRDLWFSKQQWAYDVVPNLEPSRLLCHGLVKRVTWQGPDNNHISEDSKVFPTNSDNYKTAYRVAVGNTGGEALAALLATGNIDQDLLAALQGGLLEQPVTTAELQLELHSRRFDGVQGGTVFAIQPAADDSQVIGDSNLSAAQKSAVIPSPLRDLLQALNQKQSVCDRLAREVEDCRWQVYALWYLLTGEYKDASDAPRMDKLEIQLTTFKDVLQKKKNNLDVARNARNALYTAREAPLSSTGSLINELARYPKNQPDGSSVLNEAGKPELKYRVVTSTALPFYKPAEPVIAVGGPAMARRNSYEQSGPLFCRFSVQVVTAIQLQPEGGRPQEVTGTKMLAELIPDSDLKNLDSIHKSLLGEAFLLDEQQASAIAGQVSQNDEERRRLEKIVKDLQNPHSTAGQANHSNIDKSKANPNKLIGRLPDRVASFVWKGSPWIPLQLVWEVSWESDYQNPTGQNLPDNLVTGQWKLNANGDLAAGTRSSRAPQEPANYRGYAILTPSASTHLASCLGKLDSKHPLIDILNNQDAQLQRLDGFNNALVLQQGGMQTPPLDYDKWEDSEIYYIDDIHKVLNADFAPAEQRDRFQTAPDTLGNPFLPIRAGQLRIKQLSIVDAFGQTLKLPVPEINQSAGPNDSMLGPAHSLVSEPAGPAMTLCPRFAQPMRLRFEGANASADEQKSAGPVCGWILPNHLEKSFMIYAANGKPLGALQRKLGQLAGTSEKTAFYWVDVPGGISSERQEAIIVNQHLRYFCKWALSLSPDMGGVFATLLSDAIASMDQRVPDENPGVSVLVGRPLALVRASLQFEIAGLPAHRPELRADKGINVADLIETNDFQKVKWPVRLGDLATRNDGLIGVFRCASTTGEEQISSGPLYPTWGKDNGDVIKDGIFAEQDFEIDCVQPLQLTLLMDPQARVHATTGALPRASFELPPETATGAKRAREVFFQTAPVLGFSPTPGMPRPSDDYGEWTWAYRPDVTQWKIDPNLVEVGDRAGFTNAWPTIAEGWLKLAIAPVSVLSFWIREPTDKVTAGTNLHLAWSLQGAESLELVTVKSIDGKETVERVERWDAPPFPGEFPVQVKAETTYRIIASTTEAQSDSRDLTIKIAEPKT
jgi:hypothetical protein